MAYATKLRLIILALFLFGMAQALAACAHPDDGMGDLWKGVKEVIK